MSSSSTLCQEKIQPHILTLKLAPLKSDFTHQSIQNEGTKKNLHAKMDGWSFIQSLTNKGQPCIDDQPYVHPLVKCYTDKLSEKNLEMCTEILGNETGSDVTLSSDEFSSFILQLENSRKDNNIATKKRRSNNIRHAFPSPLTSISSSKSTNSIRLKPQREGGRFILRALAIPSCKAIFHAERSHGRLTLQLLRADVDNLCDDAKEEEEKEREYEDERIYEEEVDAKKLCHQVEDNEDDDDSDEDEDEKSNFLVEGMLARKENDEGVIGIEEKIIWPNRCKERAQISKELWDWDSYWVATS